MDKTKNVAIAIGIFALQAAVLGSVLLGPMLILLGPSQIIRVPVELYDPRDLFKGDYVRITTSINTYTFPKEVSDFPKTGTGNSFDLLYPKYNKLYPYGSTWYVRLTQSSATGEIIVDSISKTKPDNGLYLKGKINRVELHEYDQIKNEFSDEPGFNMQKTLANDKGITLYFKYGFEEYYIEQGTGTTYENLMKNAYTNDYAELRIGGDGTAVIEKLDLK